MCNALHLLLLLAALAATPVSAADVEGDVEVRWLGVAGFSISSGGTTLLHDPFFTRPGMLATLFSRYRPAESVLAPLLAEGSRAPELASANVILVGHSHYDHLGDAPWIALRTGATLVGSATSGNIARGYGLAASDFRRADPGDVLHFGPFRVRVIESRHGKVLFGRVPFPGQLSEPATGPIHAFSFLLGDARFYLVTHEPSGLRILTTSSANRHAPALDALREEGLTVDLLLAAPLGRDEHFTRDLVAAVRPRLVVPHHYDSFFLSIDDPDAAAPSDPDDLAAFEEELLQAAEDEGIALEVRRLDLFETLTLSAPGQ